MNQAPLSPSAAARYIQERWHLKVHPETVRRWVRRGKLPATRTPGGYLVIAVEDLESFFTFGKSATNDND